MTKLEIQQRERQLAYEITGYEIELNKETPCKVYLSEKQYTITRLEKLIADYHYRLLSNVIFCYSEAELRSIIATSQDIIERGFVDCWTDYAVDYGFDGNVVPTCIKGDIELVIDYLQMYIESNNK